MGRVIRFTADPSGIEKAMTGAQGAAGKVVRGMQQDTMALAQQSSPIDTGRLRGQHVATPIVKTRTSVTAGVENRADYAMHVHEGTRPHVIKPRRARVLAWFAGGGTSGPIRFAKRVNHPGTKGRPWLATATEVAARRNGFKYVKGDG